MKICPFCKNTYSDDELYFCLNDGEQLAIYTAQSARTVFAEPTKFTDQNWNQYQQNSEWQNQQMMPNQQFNVPSMIAGRNQSLATASMILGIFSLLLMCCWGAGMPLGVAALITGYLGFKKIESDPITYGGRSMAIAGIVTGAISTLLLIGFIILVVSS